MKKILILLTILFLFVQLAFSQVRTGVGIGVGVNKGRASPLNVTLVPYWSDGLSLGNFDSSTNWQELSGIATAFKTGNENYLWIISDAPANMLAAISRTNGSNQGVWTFQTPPTYVDIEDIESAVIGGQPYLYFFDIGNNGNGLNSRGVGVDMRILRAKEPTITGSGGTILSTDYISIDLAYPVVNGPTLRDAEATIVDPDTGKIYIITKRDATQRVYSLDHAASYSGIQTLVYEGTMTSLPSITTSALASTPCYAVDAAINPNGTEILIKNYDNVYYFPRNKATQTIMQALQQSLVVIDGYVGGGSVTPRKSHPSQEPQGEGLTYSKDGRDLYSNSEYVASEGSTASRYPFFKYTRANKVPTTVSFQQGVLPNGSYAGASDTYIWGTNPSTDRSAETTFVLDITVGNATDDRRALLKFDLTSIPTTATVLGCRLDFWISAEGQGWSWYRMLVPWSNSSTYNSLTGGVTNDGVEAVVAPSVVNGIILDTILNVSVRDNILVSDCQNMVSNPSTNYGWLGMNLDTATGDGVQFDSAESATTSRRPKLTIRYTN